MFSQKKKEIEKKRVVTTTQIVQTSSSTSRTVQQRSISMLVGDTDHRLNLSSFGSSMRNLPITYPSSSSNTGNYVTNDSVAIAGPTTSYFQRQTPFYRSAQYTPSHSNAYKYNETGTQPRPSIPATHVPSSPLPGQIVVKKTGKLYDSATSIPTYQTHSKHRGEVLVINNIMFKDKGQRHGAKLDHKNLRSLFTQMGFNVTVECDLKKKGMISKVANFSKKNSLRNADISIVVVMSHGTKNTTLGGTEVFGLDDEGVLTEDLIECFNEESCKSMANKPKIFIFQCCRGDNEQFVASDATPIPAKKTSLTNALIAYSSLPGFVSHRDPETGTWFIRTLCDVFSKHAHEYHVEDLLKMVDVQLNQIMKSIRQTTHYENRGFKRCYLHPM